MADAPHLDLTFSPTAEKRIRRREEETPPKRRWPAPPKDTFLLFNSCLSFHSSCTLIWILTPLVRASHASGVCSPLILSNPTSIFICINTQSLAVSSQSGHNCWSVNVSGSDVGLSFYIITRWLQASFKQPRLRWLYSNEHPWPIQGQGWADLGQGSTTLGLFSSI